jgi:hypothetical protein
VSVASSVAPGRRPTVVDAVMAGDDHTGVVERLTGEENDA